MTRTTLFGIATASALTCAARNASADPWVDRALTLPAGHVSVDLAVGVGQYTSVSETVPAGVPSFSSSQKFGTGMNLEGAVGLPLGFEVGLRLGFRSLEPGIGSDAARYARLFDTQTYNLGNSSLAHPEVRVTKRLLGVEFLELGGELRAIIPTSGSSNSGALAVGGLAPSPPPGAGGPYVSHFGMMVGVPARIHIPTILRIDTGVYLPLVFTTPLSLAVSVPVATWFQVGDFFLGVISGVTYVKDDAGDPSVQLGAGAGYTVAGYLDLKAQVISYRINDDFAKSLGFGVGMGLIVW